MQYSTLGAANYARDKEWNVGTEKVSLSFRGAEMAGEVGEAAEIAIGMLAAAATAGRACNIIKKLERERIGIVGSRATLDQLADELADGVITHYLVAMQAGINLDAAVARKFNATSEKNGLSTRMEGAHDSVFVSASSPASKETPCFGTGNNE